MSILLVQFPAPASNKENLIDIEIDVPNNCTQNVDTELVNVINSGQNLQCSIKRSASNKHYKGNISVQFIVRAIVNKNYCEYELELPGRLCSNIPGEERILSKWTFVKDFDTNLQDLQKLLSTKLSFKRLF